MSNLYQLTEEIEDLLLQDETSEEDLQRVFGDIQKSAESACKALMNLTANAMDAIPGLLAGSPELRRALFPIGLFLATYIVLSLIAKLISAGVHGASTSLTLVDRTLGAVAGALKGLVLCWFLVAVLLATEAASGNEFPRLDTRGSRAAALVRKYRIPGVPSDLKALEESVLPAGVRRAVGVGGGQGD